MGEYSRATFQACYDVLLKLIRILNLQSASQDKSLVDALQIVLNQSQDKPDYFEDDTIDISFAPEKWQNLIRKKGQNLISRRYLEMAVFSCLSNELKSGDVYIEGQKLMLTIEKNYWNGNHANLY